MRDHVGANFGTSESTVSLVAAEGACVRIAAASVEEVDLSASSLELLAALVDSFDWSSESKIFVPASVREELAGIFSVVDDLHATVQRLRAEVSEKAEEIKMYVTRLEDSRVMRTRTRCANARFSWHGISSICAC